MNPAFHKYLTVLPRILMVVTPEEDRLVQELSQSVRDTCEVRIWNPLFGVVSADAYIEEWSELNHPENRKTTQLNEVLIDAYKNLTSSENDNLYYVIFDADNYLRDPIIQRRLKNLAISGHQNKRTQRTVILVSETGKVPPSLVPYVEVHDYDTPSDELIQTVLSQIEEEKWAASQNEKLPDELRDKLRNFTLPADRAKGGEIPTRFIEACRGLTIFQIKEILNYLVAEKNFEVTTEDLRERRRAVLERNELLEFVETGVSFEDVAGLERLKDWLSEVGGAWSEEGRQWGVPLCKGVLLVGVPGCGKSLTAKCLASEWDLPLVRFDPSRIFSSRVGESEANMRRALRALESLSPAVVWIDEIEKGFAGIHSSSRSDSGTTARVIGTFLSWFQDHSSDVFIVATANGIDALPPELISRFEDVFFVELPNEEARKECFEIHLQRYWTDQMGDLSTIDMDRLAKESKGLTGREIDKVIREALRRAFSDENQTVETYHFVDVLKAKTPIAKTMNEEIDALLDWVGYDPERNDGIRARYASQKDPEIEESEDVGTKSILGDMKLAETLLDVDDKNRN